MKAGNYAKHMIAGQWRREVSRFEAWWARERARDARNIKRVIKAAKRLKPTDVKALHKAVTKLQKTKRMVKS